MAPLGALSQAWGSAEASLPFGWQISGLWRFDDLRIALSEGPEFDDYLSGSGQFADQALRQMADRLRERRGGDGTTRPYLDGSLSYRPEFDLISTDDGRTQL